MSVVVNDFPHLKHSSDEFSPYSNNHGAFAGIAGTGFAILACDTRLTDGSAIFTRSQSKIIKLSDDIIFACSICWCDALTLMKTLKLRFKFYNYDHNGPISFNAASQLTANLLYQKRFFPYYVLPAIAGIHEDGEGGFYVYDSVGNIKKESFFASGSGNPLIEPLLDNMMEGAHKSFKDTDPMTKERALTILHDAFVSASERCVQIGDELHCCIVTKQGTEDIFYKLRQD